MIEWNTWRDTSSATTPRRSHACNCIGCCPRCGTCRTWPGHSPDYCALLVRQRSERLATTTFPEPPRDSGEADAVNGPTALRTHDGPATAGSSHALRRLEATGSRAGDNTLERSTAGPDARP